MIFPLLTIRQIQAFIFYPTLGLVVLLNLTSCRSIESSPAPPVQFLAFGDWGTGDATQQQVAARLAIQDSIDHSQFTLTLGDNFYGVGVNSVDDPQWKEKFLDVYPKLLKHEWYALLGNHDYYGNSQAELDYAVKDSRWKMPARYYTFTKNIGSEHHLRIICLDTNPFSPEFSDGASSNGQVIQQDANRQLKWLDSVLTASTATWTIVAGHHPIYSAGFHGNSPKMQEQVLPVLLKHRVPVYLCGHDHDLQHLRLDGIDYVLSGAASQTRSGEQPQPVLFHDTVNPGFVSFTVSADSLKARYIAPSGKVLYQFSRGQ